MYHASCIMHHVICIMYFIYFALVAAKRRHDVDRQTASAFET